MKHNKKTIVITGASSGIGAALTKQLADDGHTLFVCARRADRLGEVTEGGRIATPVVCDVSDPDQVSEFARIVSQQTNAIDVLVNCAGAYGAIGTVMEVDSEEWFDTLRTNVLGSLHAIQKFVPLMGASDQPSIINFAGGGAFDPLPHFSAYAVSKAGVVRLTETLATELAPKGILVNALAPGFVVTEIHDTTLNVGREKAGADLYDMTKQKLQEGSVPIEIPVECVRFLISENARGLTGKTLSASFDPWGSPEFQSNIKRINDSDLYSMKRINLVHIDDDELKMMLKN
jgi:ketoreductase